MKKSVYLILVFFVVFSCKTKPEVVDESQKPLDKLELFYYKTKPDKKVTCVLELNDSLVFHGKVKQRGGSSMGYAKKSYLVRLREEDGLLGMPKNRRWVLNGSYIDKSLMRNKLSYDLFRKMDKDNIAPEIKFVSFYHDGNYEGIYQLTQKMDETSLSVDSLGGIIFKDCPLFINVKIPPQEKDSYYHQKSPELEIKNYEDWMDSIYSVIHKGTNQEFVQLVEELFDINSIVDWHLMMLFSNNGDGVYKNFYLYKTDKKTKFKIAIWDYDATYGRDGDNELNMMKTESRWERNALLNRLYENNLLGYRDKLHGRWKELRENKIISVESFSNMVEENRKILEPFVSRNFERWPVNNEIYKDNYTFKQETELIAKFIKLRINQLDEELK